MKKRKLGSFLSLTLVASLVLSACSFGGTDSANGGPKDQTLVMTESAEPPNLDSAKSTDNASFKVLNNVMEGLYRLDKDQIPQPGIASGVEISPDKLVYTFKLRDAKWSDGVPVKAQDFEYSWKRALDPATASEYAYILEPVKNALEYNGGKAKKEDVGVKALDEKTLQVTLKAPTPYFLGLLSFPTYLPQRQDIVEKYADKFALEAANNVYNGPFKLTAWNHNQNYVMEKNENYWDAANVKLTKVDTKILKDSQAVLNSYQTGQVHFGFLSGDFAQKFKSDKDAGVFVEASAWYLEFNQTKPFWQNKKIRQAINLAIDKNAYANGVLKDGSIPSGGLTPPQLKANGNDPTQKFREVFPAPPQFDPVLAKQLFADGLKELGLTKAPAIEYVADDTTNSKRQMEFVKEELRKNLGIEITLTPVPFKQRLERGRTQQFDILGSGWGADYDDPMTYVDLFTTGQSYNRGKWSNKEYDALVQKSKNNANFQERMEDLAKAEKILIDDHGIAPLYYRSRVYLLKSEVQGLVFHSFGGELSYKWASIK